MTNNNQHTEEILDATAPKALTDAERALVWRSVQSRIQTRVPSPYFSVFNLHTKSMIPIILAIAILFSATGTVAASDSARPGDFLFPVDRAVENIRLSLATEEGKMDLRIKYADERLREFDSVVDDEISDDDLSGVLTEAEADIFTNETIVKLEVGDRHAYFTTNADTRAEIVAEIVSRYGFLEADVEALLSVETEDRASRAEDEPVSDEGRLRIENALSVLNSFVLETRGVASTSPGVLNALALLETKLLERSGDLPGELRMKVRDDRARIEIRGGDGDRVRIETKDGEVRVKTDDDSDRDDDSDDDDSSSDDSDDNSSDDSDDSSSALEIEADVFTDTTIVKIEQNDEKTSFSTSATTRATIISAILARYPLLGTAAIDAALDLEIENRASRNDDIEDDSDNDDDNDDDEDGDSSGHGGDDDNDDDSSDDSDDDNSGSGGGN